MVDTQPVMSSRVIPARILWPFMALSVAGCLFAQRVGGQEARPVLARDDDHAVVLELGIAASHAIGERSSRWGATIAAEMTPIENWLELEFGVTAIAAVGGTELSGDFLFKKPWRLSARAEFMAGIGPEVVHAAGTNGGTFLGTEAVLDFMYWPRKNVGWYAEPSYDLVSRHGIERGFGLSAGLLIGWR
jgi:hypothetical protein